MLSVLPLCWQQYSALQQRKSSSLLPSDTILHQTHAGQDGKHPGTKGKHFGGDLVRKLQLLHSTFTGQQGCAAGAGPEQGTALPAAQPWPCVQVAHCTELQSPQIGYKETLKPSDRPWIGLFCSSSREDLSTPYPALLSLSPGPAMATLSPFPLNLSKAPPVHWSSCLVPHKPLRLWKVQPSIRSVDSISEPMNVRAQKEQQEGNNSHKSLPGKCNAPALRGAHLCTLKVICSMLTQVILLSSGQFQPWEQAGSSLLPERVEG